MPADISLVNLSLEESLSRSKIKIRDLSGLIIIDFIDMLSYGNRKLVDRRLKEKCRSQKKMQIPKLLLN